MNQAMQFSNAGMAANKQTTCRRPAFCGSKIAPKRVVRGRSSTAQSAQSSQTKDVQFIQPMWSQVESEQQFFGVMKQLVAAGKVPEKLLVSWQDFYNNYRNAVVTSGAPGADEALAAKVQVRECIRLMQ